MILNKASRSLLVLLSTWTFFSDSNKISFLCPCQLTLLPNPIFLLKKSRWRQSKWRKQADESKHTSRNNCALNFTACSWIYGIQPENTRNWLFLFSPFAFACEDVVWISRLSKEKNWRRHLNPYKKVHIRKKLKTWKTENTPDYQKNEFKVSSPFL